MRKLPCGLLLAAGFALIVCVAGCRGPKTAAGARTLRVSFSWQGNGCQLKRPNPKITVAGVPPGTAYLRVTLHDEDAPDFRHGGGIVPYTGDGVIPAGALRDYKGPCPPSGAHRYVFRVQALNGDESVILGEGAAERPYP